MRTWETIKAYGDIRFEFYDGIAKITIDRESVYNAFRPETNNQMLEAMDICREREDIDVVVFTGAGEKAFCSGGDQNVKGVGGYVGEDGVPRLNVLDLHKKIREIPKPVVAMVNGYAIGGGHVLHVVCDLTIASENAIFGQTGPKVGSFDGGFGSSYLARHVGQKKAREIWFLCQQYSAQEALDMGLVNKVVPLDKLEDTVVDWCQIMQQRSPLALRMIKRCMNAELDGQHGLMQLAGDATLMYYLSGIRKLARDRAKKASLHNKKLRDCRVHLGDIKKDRRLDSTLFITEGDSASGSITKSRDVNTQAVFSLRGKPLNSYGMSKKIVYENEEFNLLQAALNIEESMEDLRYNNIVIATDADVDGMHIRLLLITFFLQFFPELIKDGHLYILQTPLFRVRNKKKTIYCYSEQERVNALEELGKQAEITRFKGLGEISPDEFKHFIGDDIRLDPVMLDKNMTIDELLSFYMGKNTPKRQEFIIDNLKVELDKVESWTRN